MRNPVIAIGLDAFEPRQLEAWVADGKLPVLAQLFAEGTYARQNNGDLYRTENSWLTLLQGCPPDVSQEWGHQTYSVGEYRASENAAYAFHTFPPFYAQPDRRVAVFDVPLTGLVDGVDGVQLLGWGTEVNQILRKSSPPGMMDALIERHGRHPLYDTIGNADDGSETLSYRMPCTYDVPKLRSTRDKLVAAADQRTGIILELLRSERWDLLFATYGEVHTAGHLFWHSGRGHPSEAMFSGETSDFYLDVAQAVDRNLGRLLAELPEDADLLVFSPHGMQANSIDLNSMFFLPEYLYRFTTGKPAFEGGSAGGPVPPMWTESYSHWSTAIAGLRTAHGLDVLTVPALTDESGDPLDWDPSSWFQPLWPQLKAFALPGYSDALVRINVAGRDGPGGIDPADFGKTCDELVALVQALTDPRSGLPVAAEVIRVRQNPNESGPDQSLADIIVVWREDVSTDVIDHPTLGRIGPIPFFRTGGHTTQGFVLARGQGFAAGVRLPDVSTEDVTATLLDRMGVAIPDHVSGQPIAPRVRADA